MQTVDVNGAQVAYRVDGQGPGLVLVHGTGADSRSNWEHLLGQLVPNWKVVRPDYSGSGNTEDDGGALTIKILGEQIVACAKAAGAIPFDLVGYSLGAAIATYIAAEYPELVRSVVLLAGAVSGQDQRLRLQFELWRDLIKTDRRALARMVLLTGFSPDFVGAWSQQQVDDTIEVILATNKWEGMARQVELDLVLDIREWVGRVAKPTLVIGCTHDHMVPPSHARELAEAIRGASYQEMATGHLAPLENPDEFVRILKEFLLDRTRG